MKALFPKICRPIGYTMLGLFAFFPFIGMYLDMLTNDNLVVFKTSTKLIMIVGAILLLFARRSGEKDKIEKYRSQSVSYGMFFTLVYLFVGMIYHVMSQDTTYVDGSSFLIFLIMSNVCFEFFTITRR